MRKQDRLGHYIMVEFQITIAVFILLAIILVPVLHKAKGRAGTKACISNLKQTAMGFAFYAEINMDYMPYAAKSKYKIPWTTLMISEDGLKTLTPKTVKCPLLPQKRAANWWLKQPDYGANDDLLSNGNRDPGEMTGKLSRLADPEKKILVTDSWRNMPDSTAQLNSGWYYWNRGFMLNRQNQQEGRPAARHIGSMVNTAFADTHVQTIRIPDRDSPESSPYFNYASSAGFEALRWENKQGD